jgi:hypothetical protein
MAQGTRLLATFSIWALCAFALHAENALAVEGPSFDCTQGVRQSLALILCTNAEAAQAIGIT